MSTKEHYANHLADFYEWMIGPFDLSQQQQALFFERNHISSKQNTLAIDLGAGHGLQSISLAQLGFRVKAIDFNNHLLQLLNNRKNNLPITTIEAELTTVTNFTEQAGIIVCMGDTIAHLNNFEELILLIQNSYNCLTPSGKFIISYRDYSHELSGNNRFIPVKADDEKILTCFLEYENDKVKVTDQLYEKINAGWELKVSSYYKLRLTETIVNKLLQDAGFLIIHSEQMNRMIYTIAKK